MKNGYLALGFGASLFLTGCVSSDFSYQPPVIDKPINNTRQLDMNANEAWLKVLPEIGKSFFVVNNIDRESGFINLSFSGDPEKYVNCGIISSYVKNLAGERTYNFPAASKNEAYETFDNGNLFEINRTMSLDGRINLVLQDLGNNKSMVTVNAKYIVTLGGWWKSTAGNAGTTDVSTNFNTNGGSSFAGGTQCRPVGNLEYEVLSLFDR